MMSIMLWKNLLKKCNRATLKEFYMSVNEFGEITLHDFSFFSGYKSDYI